MLNILSFPAGQDGCSGYRVRNPLEGIRNYTEHDVHIIDKDKDDMQAVTRAMPQADIIFMRPGAEVGKEQLLKIPEMKQALRHVKWVMDIDDNLECVSPFSEFYRHNGLEEFTFEGKKIWEDGKNGFHIEKNRQRIKRLLQALRDSDAIIVTTEKLAEYAKQYNDNVIVNDNTINFDEWWQTPKNNKRLRVLWAGSPSHFTDFTPIQEPLQRLMDEFDFEMIMAGSNYPGIFGKHKDRIKSLPWVVFKAHSYRMMALNADIGIIPLASDEFTQYKSAIKFYEMSAMGTPCVVSNVTPYKEVICHKNALPYSTPLEFYSQMRALLSDRGLREKCGNKAYNWVYNNKNLKTQSSVLATQLENLCQKT